ncbi:MAG: ankyrin repeat domain-containing protein [Rickettsia aeschlimannii]
MNNDAIIKPTKNSNRYTVLRLAVQNSNLIIVQKLFSLLSDTEKLLQLVNSVDESGQTALHLAISKGNTNITKLLLEAMDFENIIKSAEDSNSYIVLHLEVHSGNKNIVTKLLSVLSTDLNKLSQLLNAVDKHCQTVLHWAVSNGDTDITELLLEKMNLKDITSITRNLSLPVNDKINALLCLN